MKRLKTYKLFNESKDYNLSTIKDMLLDFTDKDINVNVTEGSWILDSKPVEYVRVRIGKTLGPKFKMEECVLDVIDYLQSSGLFLMKESWLWNDMWQHYQGCPNCLSDDFEDNYGLRGSTRCNKCEYIGPPDRFLLSQWPATIERLKLAISESKRLEQIDLLFSDRRSLYEESLNESFDQGEIDEIKSTVSDMLLELQFQDITSQAWVISDKMVQVELKKPVTDRSSAVLWNKGESFSFKDVREVIDSVSEYLSEWGFQPDFDEFSILKAPKFEVRASWGDEGTDLVGYDTCLYLKWKGGEL